MRTILAFGYEVTGTEDIISEIEKIANSKDTKINWNNFKNDDIYWDDNRERHDILVDHEKKAVLFDIMYRKVAMN